jgi:nucleoid-associated protein YgaU
MRGCRWRSSPTLLGLSVLAGSAVTGTVVADSAQAAPLGVWDRVAACESSGNWRINTGNGYFGGLQFAPTTWVEFGGRQYAPRADLATHRQQIEVARRVLAGQGPKAWPVCGKRAKLTKANGAATDAPLPRIGPVIRTVPTPNRPSPSSPRPAHTTYRVQSGDTLSAIAQRLGIPGGWQALWRLNRSHVPNPNVIFIGQSLRVS